MAGAAAPGPKILHATTACLLLVLGPAWSVRAQDAPAAKGATARRVPDELNFANGLYRDRRYDLAAEEYEKFLKSAPPGVDADEARYGLANALLFLGKYKEARAVFEDFVRIGPNHPNAPTALYRVGETAYLLGDQAAARTALERFTAANPAHRHAVTASSHLGDIHLRAGELPKAKAAYRTVLKSADGALASRARLGLARAQTSLAEYDDALATLDDLAKTGGPEWLDKAWFERGRVQLTAERFDKAASDLETLEKVAARSPLLPEARLLRADALGRLGRRDEAEAILTPLAASSGTVAASAADALGVSYLARGDADKALAKLDEALARFGRTPAAAPLAFHAAEAAQKLGRTDDARKRYLGLVESHPGDPLAESAQLRAATLSLDARDHAEARRLAVDFPARFPKSPLLADARLIEGRAALGEGKPKEAIGAFDDALARARPSPRAAQALRYYLGRAYQADGQAAKAEEVLSALAKSSAAPAAADAQFLLGQGHVEAGRFAEALPALEAYLERKPDGDVADFALAHLVHARIELGRADDARRALDDLARRFPKSKALPAARLRLAESLLAAKTFGSAAELFRASAETDDPAVRARARSGLGWALLQSGKEDEAADVFGTLISETPDDPLAPDAAYARARAFERTKKTDAALDAYARVVARYGKSPAAGAALVARGRLLLEAKRPAEAAAAFAKAVDEHPKTAGEPLDVLLAERGWALVDAGEAAEADKVFTRLLAEFPKSPKADDARVNLAESAFAAKKHDEVETLLAPVVAKDSKAGPSLLQSALHRLGRARLERKAWADAASCFDRLAAEFPDGLHRREAKFWRAEAAFRSGDGKTAEAGFDALAKEPSAPSDPPGLTATARGRRVQTLVLLERWDDVLAAAAAFKAEFPKDPQLAEVLFAKGRACQSRARFDDARAAFDETIGLRKGSELAARAQFMRGETFFHQKSYKDAIKEFLKVDYFYDIPVWRAAALLEAGKVHEQLSQWTEAAETYERLRATFPDDANAAKAQARLDAVRKRIAAAPGPSDRAEAGR